jgi:hypothetical protein
LITLLELLCGRPLCGRPTELFETWNFAVCWQYSYYSLVEEYCPLIPLNRLDVHVRIISQFRLEEETAKLVEELVEYLRNDPQTVIDTVYEVCLTLE